MTRANIAGDVSAHRPSLVETANGRALSGRAIRLGTILGCGVAWGLILYCIL